MRQRGFESHSVHSNVVLWQSDVDVCIHDVAEACRLAMPEVRVQLPLDALVRRVGKPGNPPALGAGDRQFKSDHADCIAVEHVLVRAGGC